MRIRVRYYTGPVEVTHVARRISRSDRIEGSVFAGTEHIYFSVNANDLMDGRIVAEQIIGETCMAGGITIAPDTSHD